MSSIRVLPDLLVNKIAAGEVVERPASVVKELVENAIDAGAARVAVTIEDGGVQLIRVTDDGEGMTAEDLRLAVLPHATSKVACDADLYAIASMGFRGEALPSIGAVSNLRITSRRRGSIEGHQIVVSGEKVQTAGAAGCAEGTTVEVRDLFFNVPARRKFLRTRSTETGHVNEQFARLALGFPEVDFKLAHQGKRVHDLPACSSAGDAGRMLRERIASLFGAELAGELIHVQRDERGLVIDGYAAPPIRSRSTTTWQYVFVNGRYIRDRYAQHAVREAYRGLMEHDRQPVYFLFLTISPDALDVNVHPTKMEVRWRDSNLIHSQVLSAFRETFLRTDLTPAFEVRGPGPAAAGPQRSAAGPDPDGVRRQMADALRVCEPIVGDSAPPAYRDAAAASRTQHSAPGTQHSTFGGQPSAVPSRAAEHLWRATYAPPSEGSPHAGEGAAGSPDAPTSGPDSDAVRSRRALQLHNTYLVVESDEGMLIIDQHALHERVLYNLFCERLTAGPLESQRLLLPETLTVTAGQMALLQAHTELLGRLGIEVTPFGHDAVAVQSFPALLRDTDVVPFMRDLLDKLEDPALSPEGSGLRTQDSGLTRQQGNEATRQHGNKAAGPLRGPHSELETRNSKLPRQDSGLRTQDSGLSSALSTQHSALATGTERVIHELLDMMACKAAVKAGDPLTPEEIDALIAQKDLVEKSSNCPHGRPTTLRLTVKDLEKQFKRA